MFRGVKHPSTRINGKGRRDWIWMKAATTVRRQNWGLYFNLLFTAQGTQAHNIAYCDCFSVTQMLSRPQVHPKVTTWGKASPQNIQVYESVSSHIFFLFSALLSTKDFGQQIRSHFLATEMLNSWQMMALPKHPKEIPIQLGQPELQTAGGPGMGNANKTESI